MNVLPAGEFEPFERIAQMFGVLYGKVITSGIEFHKQPSFKLLETEMQQVVDIVKEYISSKPYAFNLQ
jgi:hypothetical protein